MADETSVCSHTHIFTGGIAVPIVSIIMPVYNKEKYLPEVLEAFISQSFENWEMIIINDGSTDQSASILAVYAAIDHRVIRKTRVYLLQETGDLPWPVVNGSGLWMEMMCLTAISWNGYSGTGTILVLT